MRILIFEKTSRRGAETRRTVRLCYAFSHVLYKKEAGKKHLVYESPIVLCGSAPLREI